MESNQGTTKLHHRVAFWAGPFASCLLYFVTAAWGLPKAQCATSAVAGICAVWWVAQPVPIPVTSLIPFVVLPLLGVMSHSDVAHSFGHTLVILLMAGFMLSTAIEACGAHRRLALGMTRLVSGGQTEVPARRLLLGFMIASAVASMWISNTAAALILFPIALAACEGTQEQGLRPRLLLGVAYAASIGGMGTPIGTPPNLLFMAAHQELGQPAWSFLQWMKIGVPVMVLMIPAVYFILARSLASIRLPAVGSLPAADARERRIIWVFVLTALGWITRTEPFGGWTAWLGAPGMGDASVALAGVLLLLLLPDGRGGRLLSWKQAEDIPWGILLLFGGGIALAEGFESSGLSITLGRSLSMLSEAPEWAMLVGVCLVVTFLTEVTSNTATAALLMPVLGAAAQAAGIAPAKLMVPAALSASCAFMLPVATAPNAIVFGSGKVSAGFMAQQGFLLNLTGVLVISFLCSVLL